MTLTITAVDSYSSSRVSDFGCRHLEADIDVEVAIFSRAYAFV